ncbi:MAG TPA: hypothetical protein VHG28_03255 [Longimicrobiaceae bacterium]|nr:hypothetical protein [Longimicrobiaceae bacterium]
MVGLAMIVVGLALVLDVMYYVHGSLEQYPTREDHDKVRLVTGFFGVLLATLEIGLGLLLWRLVRTPPSPGVAAYDLDAGP